ncbi:YajG family lipoprotein [Marinomonas ostreistagni]|uniref:YajG family lipoprotein n=1 Tax=Marinomonas ostreistagni TaxID=359209 RepID=UPI00194EABEA|nr:YajG family lipoprotein [Marinomonas ostreistagni]MBM6550290.1 hypothetical protein [Marinomonas ostreistagni]
MSSKLLIATLVASALLTGCASTTHTIDIAPTSAPLTEQFSNSHRIKVSVAPYNTQTVGSIRTGIGERADIVMGNDASTALLQYTKDALAELGITPSRGLFPARTLTLEIDTLSYTTRTIALKTEATLVADIQATVTQDGKTYTANFKSEKIEQYGTLPDRHVVEEEINALLGKTVSRAFNDPQLMTLLTN